MKISIIFTVLLIILLSGCTTMGPVDKVSSKQQAFDKINPGDHVNIEMTDGRKYTTLVQSVSQKSIKGNNVEIPLNRIKTIQKSQLSGVKTVGAVIGGGAAAYIVLGTIALNMAFD